MSKVMASQADIRREEIARERGRRRPTIVALRLAELNRLLTARYGERLPDDDSGRDDVAIVAAHLAGCPGDPARRISALRALEEPVFALDRHPLRNKGLIATKASDVTITGRTDVPLSDDVSSFFPDVDRGVPAQFRARPRAPIGRSVVPSRWCSYA